MKRWHVVKMDLEALIAETKEKTQATVLEQNENPMDFISLHTHSFYSLLDAESSPQRLAEKAKAIGMKALALTDHNHLLGVLDFKKACESTDIKPIYGVELYYTDDTQMMKLPIAEQRELAKAKALADHIEIPKKAKVKELNKLLGPYMYPTKSFHILFLAKNQQGYRNLCKLQSEAARVCSVKKLKMTRFHCDNPMIAQYKEGLIMTTACLGSRSAQLILNDQYEAATELILKWHDMFQDDFYLEIQPYHHPNQVKVNKFYMQLADQYHLQLVATNDVHYANESDADDHDSLLCLSIDKKKADRNRMRYSVEFWLRDRCEMEDAFMLQNAAFNQSDSDYRKHYKIALNNTLKIADKVADNIHVTPDESLFPKIHIKSKLSPEAYLCQKCYTNLFQYLSEHPEYDKKVYLDRLAHELYVINKKGFAPYMLINEENVSWCRAHDIPVGPGRGSAAGSLVLFMLGITKVIDPIQYNLLFSRFLTMDRKAMPD